MFCESVLLLFAVNRKNKRNSLLNLKVFYVTVGKRMSRFQLKNKKNILSRNALTLKNPLTLNLKYSLFATFLFAT